jgi:pimeloyl-ACP methyl ester carboxylesterase
MRKRLFAILAVALLLGSGVGSLAQQIPFLDELFRRFELLTRLQRQKQLSGSESSAVEALRRRGEEAFKRGNIPEIIEAESEGLSLLQGNRWDERQRFISSLTLEADRLVIEPNSNIEVSLVRMFPGDTSKALAATPTVSFDVVEFGTPGRQPSAKNSPPKLSQPLPIADHLIVGDVSTNASRRLLLADGLYSVRARVEAAGQTLIELRRPIYAISNFSDSISQLSKLVASIKSSAQPAVKAVASLVATPEFQTERVAALNRSRGEGDLDPIQELDRIESELTQLSAGRNPFSSERGELERAYVASDRKLVPYRVYVPRSYDGLSPRPLVILLHGALGDEHYYFSGLFDPSVVRGEAEKRGWILAGVNGRGRFGGYRGLSLEDSFDVVNAIVRDYKVDPARIYLTGHSMGGFGTWLVAAAKPDLFAAMAPVSGGPPVQGDALTQLFSRVKGIPTLIVHGARDGIVSPEQSKAMFGAAQKAGLNVNYLESPDTDHIGVLAATFPAIMSFFEKHLKTPPEK